MGRIGSTESFLKYLKTNNGPNMNRYKIYKENVIEIESGIPMVALGYPYGLIIVDDKIPVEVFIRCYLDKIYDSLKSLENSDCDDSIREIIYFIKTRKKKLRQLKNIGS